VRERANPNFTATFHRAADRDTRRFDLTSRQPSVGHCDETEVTEGNRVTASRETGTFSFVLFAVFNSLRT
jgi:hypothetical protein